MANRDFNRKQALEKEVKEIYAEIAIGASGAPTLTYATGVASIARTAPGVYVLTLQDRYIRLMHASIMQLFAASGEDRVFQLVSQTVSTSAKQLTFRCNEGVGEADPSSGSILYVALQLKNSSVR